MEREGTRAARVGAARAASPSGARTPGRITVSMTVTSYARAPITCVPSCVMRKRLNRP